MTFPRLLLLLLALCGPGMNAQAQQEPDLIQRAAKLLDHIVPRVPRTVTIAEALRLAGSGERVTVRGTLLMETAPGFFFLKDATGGVRCRMVHPIAMKAGDVIEIATEPLIVNGAPWLDNAEAVNLGPGALPEPVPIRARDAYASPEDRQRLDAEYVRLRGVVAAHTGHKGRYKVEGAWMIQEFHVLEVDDDGVRVRVFFHTGVGAWDLYAVGTVAEFTGTCRLDLKMPDEGAGTIHLLVPDVAQVKVLQAPPFWSRRPVQQALKISLIALGGALALGLAWALGQRRKVKALRASEEQYRALSQSLEQRVNERTAELETALARQTELARLKTDFVALVSHEFRTPLEVILTSTDILDRYLERLPQEKRREYFGTIQRSVKRMSGMMEDVMLLGSMETGRLHFKPAPLDLAAFCRRLTDEMLSATSERCPITLSLTGDLSGACADEALLRHILTNLLSNASKYSPPGAGVNFHLARLGSDAVITIADTGRGIPAADRARLFESFYRGSNVADAPGTGLGLVIVHKCITNHGGSLSFESREGAGTIFTVTLPLWLRELRVES